ncbi:MAG TPA: VIT1/CCC1 transporter family protein [Dehalococcoidia bacterium]|nr:VIT1/CCC1 transporter family protein [Dehalococcoidia bacterium]
MADPRVALDTHAREELGLDPNDLGSPWQAAGSSFLLFAAGAVVPVLPYLVWRQPVALYLSALLSAVALFGIGAALSRITGRNLVASGGRSLFIGGVAATVTYLVGRVIGVTLA